MMQKCIFDQKRSDQETGLAAGTPPMGDYLNLHTVEAIPSHHPAVLDEFVRQT
jgi:hypothetical protein